MLISSGSTFLYKWILSPAFILVALLVLWLDRDSHVRWVFLGAALWIFGFALGLADEVEDHGNALLVRTWRKQTRVDLRDIKRVELSLTRPLLVTLHLDATKRPRKLMFVPRVAGMTHPHGRGTAEDLMIRVEEAKRLGQLLDTAGNGREAGMANKIDRLLTLNDDDLARELSYHVIAKLDRVPFDEMTRPEQVICCLCGVEMEVNNGGFDQFYWNSPGDLAVQTVAALEELGAPKMAAMVREANAQFGKEGPDPDRDKRGDQMEKLPQAAKDKWFDLDGEFIDYPENLSALAAAYIRKNASAFTD